MVATSRPPGGSMEHAERIWRRSASCRRRSTLGLAENGGGHQHHRRQKARQVAGDGLGVVPVDGDARKQFYEQSRAGRRELVEVEPVAGGVAQCAVAP